jgi:hypothetical protein
MKSPNSRASTAALLVAAFLVALTSGCGSGGGDSPPAPPPLLSPPIGVTATTGNAQVALSWAAAPGATSYNIYTSSTSPVTTAGTRTTVSGTATTIPALANGSPIFAAITAVNAAGESALSSEVCAVPTPASTSGLTLYDPLCGSTLNGSKWQVPPLFTRGVSAGAMVLSSRAWNMESTSSRGLVYQTSASVNASGQRVTSLQASITVPSATASRNGGAGIRAALRLAYQPPATRFDFPAASLDLLTVQVGLQDVGNGLVAFRRVSHCDIASCPSDSSSGIIFVDSTGFAGSAPAAYDTTYTVAVSLNETTGVFHWSISGGSLGTVSGTANPGAYLAGNANWSALGANPLAGAAFLNAQLRTRLIDESGGSAAGISAAFDDVLVGFDNAPAAPWDDFSGSGANSGPLELRADKWTPGEHSMSLSGGGLMGHHRITSPGTGSLTHFQGLLFSDPTPDTLQADVTVNACANSSSNGTNRIELEGRFYNDGTAGTTAPNVNRANSAVGDIQAYLVLDCIAQTARFQVIRWNTQSPLQGITLSNFANSLVPMGAGPFVGKVHTLRMKWDPATRLLTFQVNGATPVVVDPTTVNAHMSIAAPYAGPANSPVRTIGAFLSVSSANATASIDYVVNNVFIAAP